MWKQGEWVWLNQTFDAVETSIPLYPIYEQIDHFYVALASFLRTSKEQQF